MRRSGGIAIALVCAACGPASLPPAPPPEPPPPTIPTVTTPPPPDAGDAASRLAEAKKQIREMLDRVAHARGLPVRGEVPGKILGRPEILAKIRAHVDREIPREAIEHEGELLAALELVPPDYDYVEGTYKLIQGRIAGFYEPSDKTMYIVDDLTKEEAVETLAHELDHALQDQSFSIGRLIEYAAGEGDKSAAIHAILEGDATSAMLDIAAGSAFKVSPEMLRTLLSAANQASDVGKTTPHVLQASLAAPYADGYAFVQARRKAGGWAAVDAAIRAMPESTEQILHEDKWIAREPPVVVKAPTFVALGAGFRRVIDDVVGEQDLRLMLEEWVPGPQAIRGAAGWGGDRFVIARRDEANGARAIGFGWHAVMDTDKDAAELADILVARFGKTCRERPAMGPITWKRQGKDIALAAGPYVRDGATARSAGDCSHALAWVSEILRS